MQGDDVAARPGTVARLAPSYWVSQLPDLVDGDRRLQHAERTELTRLVTTGLPRRDLRATLGLVAATYWGLSVAAGLLAALALNGPPLLAIVTAAVAFFCIGQALLGLVRWVLPLGDDEAVVVWHPLLGDVLVAFAAIALSLVLLG